MSDRKEDKEKEISTKYVMKFFYEESMISGFLHQRILRIRNLMKAWRSEREKMDTNNPQEQGKD